MSVRPACGNAFVDYQLLYAHYLVIIKVELYNLFIMVMVIKKSEGLTFTEKILAALCEKTFLKIWAYPNLYKSDGKELCDVLAIFENHVFLFFDRECKKFEKSNQDILLQWARWEKEVIQKQLITADGAKRYILSYPDKIYLDQKNEVSFPILIPKNIIVHKIIVAHGAEEACKSFSSNNISGSLAIGYRKTELIQDTVPFMVHMNKEDSVHIFDSHNLEIILGDLDTVYDFTAYITAKEEAIKKYDFIYYCGEEDLLAYYYSSFDSLSNKYSIGVKDKSANGIFIGEGEWQSFIKSKPYQLRKDANKKSIFWDNLLQTTCQNTLDDTLKGNGNIFNAESAIHEMAKEPRFSRRSLSEAMISAINNFPENISGLVRNISFMPSFYEGVAYVFLQIRHPNIIDYDNDYRPRKQVMLEIACGAAKNKFPQLNKIIGIGIDAPKFSLRNAEDFILLDCVEWPEELRQMYEKENEGFKFFKSGTMKQQIKTIRDFPTQNNFPQNRCVARNAPCPCGSEKKYKRCCGL